MPEAERQCFEFITTEALAYDYTQAATLFSTISGALAAFSFAVLVFLLERRSSVNVNVTGRTALLLLITFIAAIVTSYQYSIVSADGVCERIAVLANIAGITFAIVVIAMLVVMARLITSHFSELTIGAPVAGMVLLLAVIATSLELSMAANVMAIELGKAPVFWQPLTGSTLAGLLIALLVWKPMGIWLRWAERDQAGHPPFARAAASCGRYGVFIVIVLYLFLSLVAFNFVEMEPIWTAEALSDRPVLSMIPTSKWRRFSHVLIVGFVAGMLAAEVFYRPPPKTA